MAEGGQTAQQPSGWTIDTLKALVDERHAAQTAFATERDRRYTEVAQEREKALKIKEEADKAALALAREIQTYKDEKANELREQINSERGLYASKQDVINSAEKIEQMIKPLAEYVQAQQGRSGGIQAYWGWIVAGMGILIPLAAVVATLLAK